MILAAAMCIAGLTAGLKPIPCTGSLDNSTTRSRVVLIGGLDGSAGTAAFVSEAVRKGAGRGFSIAAIPLANPERGVLRFPPEGGAYANLPESHALWRWIGISAPDILVVVGPDNGGLAAALRREAPAGVGMVHVMEVDAKPGSVAAALRGKDGLRSEARIEMDRRTARTPEQVARQLAAVYGYAMPEPVYIPAVTMLAHLRLGRLVEIEHAVAPYVSGERDSLAQPAGSDFAGHLLFAELALRTGQPRYIERVRAAADTAFEAGGKPKEAMPLHNEMSDAVFMSCPILAAAGKLTGEAKYFEMALRHLVFMQKLDLRADGLYRHSPLDEAAWGRGNAFPALGLAWTLSYLPRQRPEFDIVLRSFREHMRALARHTGPSGMWRQVIDHEGSYAELTATCMIGAAMIQGVREGWLPARPYRDLAGRAWEAAKRRIGADGRLIDVCTSTGKQRSLRDYLHRTAILGIDPRGGAMAMRFATEMAGMR